MKEPLDFLQTIKYFKKHKWLLLGYYDNNTIDVLEKYEDVNTFMHSMIIKNVKLDLRDGYVPKMFVVQLPDKALEKYNEEIKYWENIKDIVKKLEKEKYFHYILIYPKFDLQKYLMEKDNG